MTRIAKNEAYNILSLNQNATELEIKKAYRKLSLKHHPKKNNDSQESKNRFKEVQEAYKILSAE